MPEFSYTDIQNQIKKRQLRNIYLLQGSEPFFIDSLTNLFIGLLDDDARDFNLNILYGNETSINTVLDNLSQFPMGSEFRVVIVKNAQLLKDIKSLAAYAASPFPPVVLVLCHEEKNLDGKLKLSKEIKEKHAFFESKPLWDNQVPGWIKQQFLLFDKKISDYNAALMAEFLGNDLKKIHNEIEKLNIVTTNEPEITQRHIEQYIGISRNFNTFELSAALAHKDIYKAHLIASYLGDNIKDAQLPMIISGLFNFVQRLFILSSMNAPTDNEISGIINSRSRSALQEMRAGLANYARNDIYLLLDLLKKYDQYSKGLNAENVALDQLLKELVFKFLNIHLYTNDNSQIKV